MTLKVVKITFFDHQETQSELLYFQLHVSIKMQSKNCNQKLQTLRNPLYQRLDKASNSDGARLLKTVNFKVILKIPGGHITMFSTRA